MRTHEPNDRFTAPWLFAAAVFVFSLALIEKGLNLVGLSIPLTTVFPRQLLDWAVTLLIFDIALTLRQSLDRTPTERAPGLGGPGQT
jgi:hypothetical protein